MLQVELKPGMKFEFMDVYYSKYRGYTLVNVIDSFFSIDCEIWNTSEFLDTYRFQIKIHSK